MPVARIQGVDIYDAIAPGFHVLLSAIHSVTTSVRMDPVEPLTTIFENIDTISDIDPFVFNEIKGLMNKPYMFYTGALEPGRYGLQVQFYKKSIECHFAQFDHTNTWRRNHSDTNNISMSWDSKKGLYKYGVKMSNKYPYIRGSIANRLAFQLAQSCRVRRLMISDSAYVPCLFSKNISPDIPVIDIDNFSIARILNGKRGFYHTSGVTYMEPEAAQRAIEFLRSEYTRSLSDTQKEILREFATCMKNKTCHTIEQSNCYALRTIIEEAREALIIRGFVPVDGTDTETVLDKLVYTSQSPRRGGKKQRKKTRKKRKQRKKTRKRTK